MEKIRASLDFENDIEKFGHEGGAKSIPLVMGECKVAVM